MIRLLQIFRKSFESKTLFREVFLFSFIVSIGLVFNARFFDQFPTHTHGWAQSDRYAISLGFLNNGFDFFHPEMSIYNHQFPGFWEVPGKTTISAVDFPIHDYIVALIMKLTNSESLIIYRIYVFIYSLIGLFFLYRLSNLITNSFWKSLVITCFSATSPVFAYYQAAMLPTIPSLSNAIIGIYLYYRYLYSKDKSLFYWSILFLTLAALARTTFAIPLISVFITEIIRVVRYKSKFIFLIIPALLSCSVLIAYVIYNSYLRNEYGSNFLHHFLPPRSWDEMIKLVEWTSEAWTFQYFTKFHYLFFFVSVICGCLYYFIKKSQINSSFSTLFLMNLGYISGCGLFLILMFRQFPSHDYYFLDTFYLPTILFLVLTLSLIPTPKSMTMKLVFGAIGASFIAGTIAIAEQCQESRLMMAKGGGTEQLTNNFIGSDLILDSLGISKEAKILVFDVNAPSIPFILMKRNGYAVINLDFKTIRSAMEWEFDLVVFQKSSFVNRVYNLFPKVIQNLEKVAETDRLIFCKKVLGNDLSLYEFLNDVKLSSILNYSIDFESALPKGWNVSYTSTSFKFAGSTAGSLAPHQEYGLTYKTLIENNRIIENARALKWKAFVYCKEVLDCNLVVSLTKNGEHLFYSSKNLKEFHSASSSWVPVELFIELPPSYDKNCELAVYLWNAGKSNFYYDNVELDLY